MSGRAFLDTNVLVYLYDRDSPEKQSKARKVLEQSAAGDGLVISTQVLQEFYVSITRKLPKRLPEADALLAMHGLRRFPTVLIDVPMIFNAIELTRRFQMAFWDGLIVQAALSAGCTRLLTEDLQHEQRIGALRVENPFVGSPG
jgi:predicted nucleic acid-binding protein